MNSLHEQSASDRAEQLRRVGFLADRSAAALDALATIAVTIDRPAGTLIQFEGDPAEAMYIVIDGRVKISRLALRGREQVLHVAGPGDHFNSVPIFDGGPCPANAQSLTSVRLLVLPRAGLIGVIEQHPEVGLALLREFTGRLRQMVNLIDDLALHTVQGRLARLLLSQAEAAERGEESPALTQADMASRLGTVREIVARTLKGYEAQGLLRLDRGVITIVDRAGLEDLCEE